MAGKNEGELGQGNRIAPAILSLHGVFCFVFVVVLFYFSIGILENKLQSTGQMQYMWPMS